MPPVQPRASNQKALTAFAVVIIVGILIGTAVSLRKTAPASDATATTPTIASQTPDASSPSTLTAPTATSATSYQNGSFTASSDYAVPRSFESIKVTLTLQDGVVTNSSISNSEGDRESAQYQERFAAVYKSYVVGKKISDLKLSYVAGASDTTGGFNDALAQIRQQAQS